MFGGKNLVEIWPHPAMAEDGSPLLKDEFCIRHANLLVGYVGSPPNRNIAFLKPEAYIGRECVERAVELVRERFGCVGKVTFLKLIRQDELTYEDDD